MEDVTFDYSNLKTFSGYYKDSNLLKRSASGGAASILSETIIKNGGVVFGTDFSSDFQDAVYLCIDNIGDLERIKGSKYISTSKRMVYNGEDRNVYDVVFEKIKERRLVLFVGLGCDIGGLYQYLKKHTVDVSNLFTVDLICHDPALKEIHRQYISNLQKKYGSPIVRYSMKYKTKNWISPHLYAEFENGKIFDRPFYDTDFGMMFRYYSPLGCYKCKFKGSDHCSDITIGDHWGLSKFNSKYNVMGMSIFFVRTEKGMNLVSKINENDFYISDFDTHEALINNPMYYMCREKPFDYNNFVYVIEQKGLHVAAVKKVGLLKYCLKTNYSLQKIINRIPMKFKKTFFTKD
ncbi:MAG: Coenzyme F420 hydrogenase/dehydrogenase, beta subunit C-terminal domain [Methanosphaera sp.]|nr:Coenzyme F420 hydrogenase/dehydrogenase, beta subunit C-terminal domain [Methanosphaera sp.]